jgi:acyl-CoA reductase-like NAD-dependent aldehyde dehydrogenase
VEELDATGLSGTRSPPAGRFARPLGVVGLITPWNFPAAIPA